MFSGMAPQLIGRKDPSALGEASWTALATSSFPTPLSPQIRTGKSERAIFFHIFENLDHQRTPGDYLLNLRLPPDLCLEEQILSQQLFLFVGLPDNRSEFFRLKAWSGNHRLPASWLPLRGNGGVSGQDDHLYSDSRSFILFRTSMPLRPGMFKSRITTSGSPFSMSSRARTPLSVVWTSYRFRKLDGEDFSEVGIVVGDQNLHSGSIRILLGKGMIRSDASSLGKGETRNQSAKKKFASKRKAATYDRIRMIDFDPAMRLIISISSCHSKIMSVFRPKLPLYLGD